MACELAGNYMNRLSNFTLAKKYWEQSHCLDLGWGATTKAAQVMSALRLLDG